MYGRTITMAAAVTAAFFGVLYVQYRYIIRDDFASAASVCQFVHANARAAEFSPCANYACTAEDTNEGWIVRYECPSLANFPLNQTYLFRVNAKARTVELQTQTN